jgi:hypothetical protein
MGLGKLNKIAKTYTSAIADKAYQPKDTDANELEKRRKELMKKELEEGPEGDESEESSSAQKEEDTLGVELHDRSKRKPKKKV